jgi:phosphatidate cytidylyltransferase
MKRVLTAVLLAPLIAWVVLWGPPYLFWAVLAAVALLCFYEYSGIVAACGVERPGALGYAAGLLVLFLPGDTFLAVTLATLLALALALDAGDLAKGWPRAAYLLLGVVYIFGAWRFALLLWARNPYWLFFVLVLNWLGDAAAYYLGRAVGRHKLAPRVSPAKSWEGAVASLAASVLFGVIYLTKLIPQVSLVESIAFSVAGNLAGQVGDLAESALKRGAGVKDSGNWLPGHGGWLDRVDGTLFSLPVVYGLLSVWPQH